MRRIRVHEQTKREAIKCPLGYAFKDTTRLVTTTAFCTRAQKTVVNCWPPTRALLLCLWSRVSLERLARFMSGHRDQGAASGRKSSLLTRFSFCAHQGQEIMDSRSVFCCCFFPLSITSFICSGVSSDLSPVFCFRSFLRSISSVWVKQYFIQFNWFLLFFGAGFGYVFCFVFVLLNNNKSTQVGIKTPVQKYQPLQGLL